MGKLRVLIVEDHETVREGLKLIVGAQKDIEIVGEAGDGRVAIELARELQPDIVLMDISMPELNGLKAAAKLKRIAPEIKILTLTRHSDTAYLRELLEAGISGYVLKQSPSTELIRAIRAVAEGGNYLDAAVTGKVISGFTGNRHTMPGETGGKQLTNRESEILRYIALGYSQKEIAEKIDISVKTVEAHKATSLKKLHIKSRIDIMRYAVQQGWMDGK